MTLLQRLNTLVTIFTAAASVAAVSLPDPSKVCNVKPLGHGRDDTSQVQAAIDKCGHFGTTSFAAGVYNITRKMTWDLQSAKVDLRGYLNFQPDIDFWLDARNTYRVVFIQSQASWFVVTGSDFEIDAHNTGGIQGNGQPWWSAFATPPRTRQDGDGRPIALTLWKVTRGIVRNFRIESPPFWSNAVAQSSDVTYDGMFINATNEDPKFFGQK
jgi:galacturan 1,4-alpha-galacturonidase